MCQVYLKLTYVFLIFLIYSYSSVCARTVSNVLASLSQLHCSRGTFVMIWGRQSSFGTVLQFPVSRLNCKLFLSYRLVIAHGCCFFCLFLFNFT